MLTVPPQQHPVTALCCSTTLLDRKTHGFQERKNAKEGRGTGREGTGREVWALARTCFQPDGSDRGTVSAHLFWETWGEGRDQNTAAC